MDCYNLLLRTLPNCAFSINSYTSINKFYCIITFCLLIKRPLKRALIWFLRRVSPPAPHSRCIIISLHYHICLISGQTLTIFGSSTCLFLTFDLYQGHIIKVFFFRYTPSPPPHPYGSNWGHEITDFVFLALISFIIAFRAFHCIGRSYETIYRKSRKPARFTPRPPLWVKLENKIADFVFLPQSP